MKIREVVSALESLAPLALQEEYDNAGLITGNPDDEISKILVCLDVTEDIVRDAAKSGAGLIVSHHPVIFRPLKKITGESVTERIVIHAVRNQIALLAMHTNLDNMDSGVNYPICEKLGLGECKVLKPAGKMLKKLITFCPDIRLADGSYVPDTVRMALFEAGGGHIGNYDCCSYNTTGTGTFRALENTRPFIGEKFSVTEQKEIRIEVIFPAYLQGRIVKALFDSHPYEEVAYDIYSLENEFEKTGAGMIGNFVREYSENEFLEMVRSQLDTKLLKHSSLQGKKIKKVAVCGGAGGFLIRDAIRKGADAYLTAEIKYHDFAEFGSEILLVDAGHYETEQFTINLLYDFLRKKFPNFAVQKITINANPINYL